MADLLETLEGATCVVRPAARPEELAPLVAALQAGEEPEEARAFPRGTLLADGRLDLCKQALGPPGAAAVARALRDNGFVRHLLMGADALGDEGVEHVAELVAENPGIETVFLGCNGITARGVERLVTGARTGKGLRALWLKRNPLGPDGVRALAPLLEGPGGLHTLDLCHAELGAEGLEVLTAQLRKPEAPVRRLYLGGVGVTGPEALAALVALVEGVRGVEHLFLDLNELGDAGVQALAAVLPRRGRLATLSLASVGMGDAGADALARALRGGACVGHLDIGHRAATATLGMDRNVVGDSGAAALAEALTAGAELASLSLAGNCVGLAGALALAEALESGAALEALELCRTVPKELRRRIRRAVPARRDLPVPPEVRAVSSVYRPAKPRRDRRGQGGEGSAPARRPPRPEPEERPGPEAVAAATAVLEAMATRPADFFERDPALAALRAGANRLVSRLQDESRRRRDARRGVARRKRSAPKEDREAVSDTGIRRRRRLREEAATALARGESEPAPAASAGPRGSRRLRRPRRCYVCREPFHQVDEFYDSHCPGCATFSRRRREETAPMQGRHVLLTGGRIKIGRAAALRFLRAGAHVTVTTRFPWDAARRYAAEPDHEAWGERLRIRGLELLDLPGVLASGAALAEELPRLDALVHNAAMTIRRPREFYADLLAGEEAGSGALPDVARHWVEGSGRPPLLTGAASPGLPPPADLPAAVREAFPPGLYEDDGQQADRRERNSWVLELGEVDPRELVEVHAVSCLAPFLLTQALLPSLKAAASRPAVIVHVSAMEGNFSRATKRPTHPHTNMAKAAMNMLTRTSGEALAAGGVALVSVDTGWVTDENPWKVREDSRSERGFEPPLDEVEGAARVTDPVYRAARGEPVPSGVFLKDYRPHPW